MLLNASIHNISVIPVAIGTTNADVTACTPTTVSSDGLKNNKLQMYCHADNVKITVRK